MRFRRPHASLAARAQFVARFIRAFSWRERLRMRSEFNQAFAKHGVGFGMVVRDGLVLGVELTDPDTIFAVPEGVKLEFKWPTPADHHDDIEARLHRLICGNGTTTGDSEAIEQRKKQMMNNKPEFVPTVGGSGYWSLEDMKRIAAERDPHGELASIPADEIAATFDAFAAEPIDLHTPEEKAELRQSLDKLADSMLQVRKNSDPVDAMVEPIRRMTRDEMFEMMEIGYAELYKTQQERKRRQARNKRKAARKKQR